MRVVHKSILDLQNTGVDAVIQLSKTDVFRPVAAA